MLATSTNVSIPVYVQSRIILSKYSLAICPLLGRMTPGAASVATLGSMLQDKGYSGFRAGLGLARTGGLDVTSGIKGAPVKENKQRVKSDVGEPQEPTFARKKAQQ
jgi:hypothetical protein